MNYDFICLISILCVALWKHFESHTHTKTHIPDNYFILFAPPNRMDVKISVCFFIFSSFPSNQMIDCFMCFYFFFFLFSLTLVCMPRDNEIFVLVLLCESLLQQIYWIIEKEKKEKANTKCPKNIPWSWWHSYGCESWRIKKGNITQKLHKLSPLRIQWTAFHSHCVSYTNTHTRFNLYLFSV